MAASNETVAAVKRILVEEVGAEKAARIIRRIGAEVRGNESFMQTMVKLGKTESADERAPRRRKH